MRIGWRIGAVSAVVGALFGPASAFSASGGAGPPLPAALESRLQQVVSIAHQMGVPGVAVQIVVPGRGSWSESSGISSLEGSTPLPSNAEFRVASITKTFTATVVLQLVQAGKLHLDDPISKWVPTVQQAGQITIQMLLDMTSGIADEGGAGSELVRLLQANPRAVISPQKIVAMAVAQGPAQPPGQGYAYSDTNYVILGLIAQAVTGRPISQLIASQVLNPTGLRHTSWPTSTAVPPPGTSGYVGNGSGDLVPQTIQPSTIGAAGALVSDVADMTKWAAVLGRGSLLDPSTQATRLSFIPTGDVFEPLPGSGVSGALPISYGLGIMSYGGLLGHDGILAGYNAVELYQPSTKATIVVLLNGEGFVDLPAGGLESIADAMAVSFADLVFPGQLQSVSS